jgi:hypothetical protein
MTVGAGEQNGWSLEDTARRVGALEGRVQSTGFREEANAELLEEGGRYWRREKSGSAPDFLEAPAAC